MFILIIIIIIFFLYSCVLVGAQSDKKLQLIMNNFNQKKGND